MTQRQESSISAIIIASSSNPFQALNKSISCFFGLLSLLFPTALLSASLISGFTDQVSSFGEKSLFILPLRIRRQEAPLLGKQLLSFLIYSSDCIFPPQGGKRKEGHKGTPETAARSQETNWSIPSGEST